MGLPRTTVIVSAALLAASCLATAGFGQAARAAPAPAAADAAFPAGPGRELTIRVCSGCHSPAIVAHQRLTRQGWADLIDTMAGNGATATDAEFARTTDYLARNFPAKTATPAR